MKRIISIFMIFTLCLVFALNVGATEAPDALDTDIPVAEETEAPAQTENEAVQIPESTETQNEESTAIPEATHPPDDTVPGGEDGEEYIPIDEFLLGLWNEYRDTLFAGISTIFSIIVAQAFKNRTKSDLEKEKILKKKEAEDKKALKEFEDLISATLKTVEDKLESFENYDVLAKETKRVLAESQLDRQVLIKTIEMQADQIEHLIEYSSLPQARKDKLYEEYRTQQKEIEKLKGESDEA